jgi:hypothetical protein
LIGHLRLKSQRDSFSVAVAANQSLSLRIDNSSQE